MFHTSASSCGGEVSWANHLLLQPQIRHSNRWTQISFLIGCLPHVTFPKYDLCQSAAQTCCGCLGPMLHGGWFHRPNLGSPGQNPLAPLFPRPRRRGWGENIRPVRRSGSLRPLWRLLWRHVWPWTSAWAGASDDSAWRRMGGIIAPVCSYER